MTDIECTWSVYEFKENIRNTFSIWNEVHQYQDEMKGVARTWRCMRMFGCGVWRQRLLRRLGVLVAGAQQRPVVHCEVGELHQEAGRAVGAVTVHLEA